MAGWWGLTSMLTVGLGGVARHGCVALSEDGVLLGVCEQERITRQRAAGFNASGLPDEALDATLERLGRRRDDVGRYIAASEGEVHGSSASIEHIDHHLAHACTAYLTSSFSSAAILVCDHESPKVSVWQGQASSVTSVDWQWHGAGLVDLYSRCAAALGFQGGTGDQRMEALARLRPDSRDERLDRLFRSDGSGLTLEPGWETVVANACDHGLGSSNALARAGTAAALQARIIDLVLELLADVRRRTSADRICLGGSLFHHSSVISAVKAQGVFTEVFVPVDPGNAGSAVGAALHGSGGRPQMISPFLGPMYTAEEIKETVDNCKLRYSWESEAATIDLAVRELMRGNLVGWFDGPMEWGPRALGGRCILANPFAPYVLENLNRFLKRRESWRGYALSGLPEAVSTHFDGPRESNFMECDFRPRDGDRFRPVLPVPGAAVRVHTAGAGAPPRFVRLLAAFGAASGVPVLVNTSFNGFHEPIVCNPRDAVRVFYGSGLDLLVLGQFVIAK